MPCANSWPETSRMKADLAQRLAQAAEAYQAAVVIPHCARCSAPCCRLDKLVLDLEWRQVRVLWQVQAPRAEFDRKRYVGEYRAMARGTA